MRELLIFISVITVHEMGHIITAYFCGAKIRRLRPVPCGLRIEFDGAERMPYYKELLICSGGMIFNLISLFLPFAGELFRAYSIGAAVYNLCPFSGSDGGGIVYITTLYFTKDPFSAERVRRGFEDLFMLILWGGSVYLNLCGKGSFPLLLSVVILIIIRIKKDNEGNG